MTFLNNGIEPQKVETSGFAFRPSNRPASNCTPHPLP